MFVFRCVKLRPRRPDAAFPVSLIDYEEFCGAAATDKDNHDPERTMSGIDPATDRMTVREYKQMYLDAGRSHLLLDVRTRPEMEICRLPKANLDHVFVWRFFFLSCMGNIPLSNTALEHLFSFFKERDAKRTMDLTLFVI